MKLYTAEEMKAIDHHAIEVIGVEAAALMETAGRAVAHEALRMMDSDVKSRRVIILVGKGNNGGDGLVAARVLHDAGAVVQVAFAGSPPSTGDGSAAANLKAATAMGIAVHACPAAADIPEFNDAELCIDALLGVGARGAPTGVVAAMVKAANATRCPRLAVDIPTGLDASTGAVPGDCIRADVTVTFGHPKVGLYSDPGRRYVGRVKTADIGIPRASSLTQCPRTDALDAALVRGWLPPRNDWANKGSFGSVLVVAGAAGMLGAGALCALASLRSGAGLVRWMVPHSLLAAANSLEYEIICRPAPGDETFSPESCSAILEQLASSKAIAIGPGLTNCAKTADLLEALLPQIKIPLLIDADGLNILAQRPHIFQRLQVQAVITPHPGEMARLAGMKVEDIQGRRIDVARQFAAEHRVVVVLKGAATVVANPEGETLLNTSGNPGMATAGMGDVLSGTVAGMLAQGLEPFQAAGAAVFLHGLAGDLAASEKGNAGIVASDAVHELPAAQMAVRNGNVSE